MIKRTLLQLMATAALALLFQSGAYAHSALNGSSPENGATVSAPSMLMLTFVDVVRLVKVELVGPGGVLETGFAPMAEAAKMFHVPVSALAAGEHRVNWSIVGADGHAVSESFRFTVDPTASAAVMNHGSAMPMSHDPADMHQETNAMPMDHGDSHDHGDMHQDENVDGGHQH
jgi:methionine-rich copper-binding protein CopC